MFYDHLIVLYWTPLTAGASRICVNVELALHFSQSMFYDQVTVLYWTPIAAGASRVCVHVPLGRDDMMESFLSL